MLMQSRSRISRNKSSDFGFRFYLQKCLAECDREISRKSVKENAAFLATSEFWKNSTENCSVSEVSTPLLASIASWTTFDFSVKDATFHFHGKLGVFTKVLSSLVNLPPLCIGGQLALVVFHESFDIFKVSSVTLP